MATARCAAFAVGNIVTLVTIPADKKLVLDAVSIDNGGAADHTIHFRDDFTADPSAGAAIPGPNLIEKGQWTVGHGVTGTVPENELKEKKFLGTLKCYADGAEPACIVLVDYHFE